MSTNLFERLRALVPATPLAIVEILVVNADGTSTVEFPGGAQQAVRGTSVPVGGFAFVRGDVIEMAAPARVAITIDV